MSESRDALRLTFDTAADLYEAARPAYPRELFDDLVELAELEPGRRLLEIGCATGKATRPLLERGFSIVCVELGEQLAAHALRDLAGLPVEIDVAPFEDWQAERESFDLVYAATAWHWLDPAVRYREAHQLLRPRGHPANSAASASPTRSSAIAEGCSGVLGVIGRLCPLTADMSSSNTRRPSPAAHIAALRRAFATPGNA